MNAAGPPVNRRIAALAMAGVITALSLSAAGCAGKTTAVGARSKGGAPAGHITVAAASDLKLALPEIVAAFEKRTGNKVTATFGSSGLLARQIEQGAPFDVYLSANKGFIKDLVKKDLLVNETRYGRGLIALIGKAGSLEDLADPAIKNLAIANPETAPYGAAARDALQKAGVWPAVQDKTVIAESISHAKDFVDTGNADAGVVALALVKTTGAKYTVIDKKLYTPIEQWAGVISGSREKAAARAFVDGLSAPATKKILEKYGFETAGPR